MKIATDGTVLFCDELLTKILNRPSVDVNELIGREIWKILCGHNAEKELKGKRVGLKCRFIFVMDVTIYYRFGERGRHASKRSAHFALKRH